MGQAITGSMRNQSSKKEFAKKEKSSHSAKKNLFPLQKNTLTPLIEPHLILFWTP